MPYLPVYVSHTVLYTQRSTISQSPLSRADVYLQFALLYLASNFAPHLRLRQTTPGTLQITYITQQSGPHPLLSLDELPARV